MEILNKKNRILPPEKSFSKRLTALFRNLPSSQVDEFVQRLIYNSTTEYYEKNSVVGAKISEQHKFMYFVYSGVAHSFIRHPKYKDQAITKKIWTKNKIIFDFNGYLNGTAATETTQMLEGGHLVSISSDSLRTLIHEHPKMMCFLTQLQTEHLLELQAQIELLKLPVMEKVTAFVKDHPSLIHRINNNVIATLLHTHRSRFSTAIKGYKISDNGTTTSKSRY